MLMLRGMGLGLVQLAVLAALLILPAGLVAGEWGWMPGWWFLLVYGAIQQASIAALGVVAPASLEARLRPLASREQPRGDRLATTLIILSGALVLTLIPLEALVWRVFPPPPVAGAALAGLVTLTGYGLVLWVLFANRFAIPIVEDQSRSGQVVIATGPYAIVRHPMYLGALLFLMGIGPLLGSLLSLAAVPLVVLALSLRIGVEERMLCATLPGYAAYCARRRWRLVPLLW